VFAVAVDTQSWETRGTSVPILPDAAADPITHGAQYDVADNGTLVYRKTSSADSTTLVRWLDRAGRQEPLLSKPGAYLGPPRLSPDGRRLALTVQDGANSDIWVYDTQREGLTLLTAGGGTFENPTWTRKGHVVFESRGLGIHWTRADGGGQPRALTTPGLEWPTSVTTDGRVLAVSRVGAAPQIWSVELTEDASGLKAGEQRQLRTSASSEDNAAFSPDGRWMAYVSDESGKPEVYVSPFPAPEGAESRVQISSGGGLRPVWAPKASEVLYHIDGRIMAVPYSTSGGSFVAEKPRPWSSADVTGVIGFDVAPDGRVVIIVPAAAGKTSQSEHMIGFMQNVFDELRRRVPVAR
jgi:Tol biopolymer transport system component